MTKGVLGPTQTGVRVTTTSFFFSRHHQQHVEITNIRQWARSSHRVPFLLVFDPKSAPQRELMSLRLLLLLLFFPYTLIVFQATLV